MRKAEIWGSWITTGRRDQSTNKQKNRTPKLYAQANRHSLESIAPPCLRFRSLQEDTKEVDPHRERSRDDPSNVVTFLRVEPEHDRKTNSTKVPHTSDETRHDSVRVDVTICACSKEVASQKIVVQVKKREREQGGKLTRNESKVCTVGDFTKDCHQRDESHLRDEVRSSPGRVAVADILFEMELGQPANDHEVSR